MKKNEEKSSSSSSKKINWKMEFKERKYSWSNISVFSTFLFRLFCTLLISDFSVFFLLEMLCGQSVCCFFSQTSIPQQSRNKHLLLIDSMFACDMCAHWSRNIKNIALSIENTYINSQRGERESERKKGEYRDAGTHTFIKPKSMNIEHGIKRSVYIL